MCFVKNVMLTSSHRLTNCACLKNGDVEVVEVAEAIGKNFDLTSFDVTCPKQLVNESRMET